MSIFIRVSNPSINQLVNEVLKEFTETSKRVSPRLIYLAKLAKHYKTFEEFENDYQMKNFHGIYWHLTTNPDFVINPKQSPTDLSSLAGAGGARQPGLMVSTDIGNWHDTFNQRRQYAVQIDLSDLTPNVDYRYVGRGFGHEIYVFKPEGAKVVKILPVTKAMKQNYDDYRRNLPQNQQQLRRLYDLVHQKDINENSVPKGLGLPSDVLTKKDEMEALQFIRTKIRDLMGDVDELKTLRRVRDIKDAPNAIRYTTSKDINRSYFNFRIVKMDGIVYVQDDAPTNPNEKYWYSLSHKGDLKEDIGDNFHINKEEEDWALQKIRKFRIGDETVGKNLRKVRHIKNPNGGDVIDYMTGDKNTAYPSLIRLIKVRFTGSNHSSLYASFPKVMVNDRPEEVDIPLAHYRELSMINENYQSPNLHISKEEEERMLQYFRKRKNNQGEPIGRYLKKIQHIVSDGPNRSDRIKYKNIDDETTYTIAKDRIDGKIGWYAGYVAPTSPMGRKLGADYESNWLDKIDTIDESVPTGDWQSWGMITQPEKDRLKIVLDGYIRHIRNIYHPHIAEPKAYLIKKVVDNLDVSDPRFAAKPLARLGMEDRLALGDFVDHADTGGFSSKVMNFLLNISREYIQPPRPPEPDIVLDKIARVVWPSGTRMSDVTIHGLDDMQPIIGFGHGGYSLTDNFIKQYSKPGVELYIDLGADVRVTNMPEVMKAVKQALERDSRSLSEGKYFGPMTSTIPISKEEEARAFEWLKRGVVNGVRLGSVLKKTHVIPSTEPKTSDIIIFSGKVHGKDVIYRLYKGLRRGLEVRDASPDGDFKTTKVPMEEATISSYHINHQTERPVISKKDDDLTFEFLKNKVIDGERLGKTLRKSRVIKSTRWSESDIIIYTADIKGRERVYRLVKKVEQGIVRLVVSDISPGGSSRIWIVPT